MFVHIYAPVKVNPRPAPHSPNPGEGGSLDKRTRESAGQYFHSNVLAFPRLPVKVHINFIKNIRASE